MPETTFTFRVEENLKKAFTQAAQASDRKGAQLLRDFMRDFIRQQEEAAAHDRWFKLQVRQGIAEADAGAVISAEDVEREAESWRADMRKQMGGA